jgi:hypothetical protein
VEILDPHENDRAVVCQDCGHVGPVARQHDLAIEAWNEERNSVCTYTASQIAKIKAEAFSRGVRSAAEMADTYNRSSSHPYMLGDCILHKLNQTTRKKPRKNIYKLTGASSK